MVRCARAVVFVCLGLSAFVVRPAAAARGARTDRPSAAEQAEARQERAAQVARAEQAVVKLIERQMVRPIERRVIAAEAKRIVAALDDEQVGRLLSGDNVSARLPHSGYTVKIAGDRLSIAGAESAPGTPDPAAAAPTLGDSQSDLLFVPITPCRIIDTRLAGGPIAAASTRAFVVTGTANFEAQGGKSGGCGIPQGSTTPLAAAVSFNFVAVTPRAAGDLRAWPYGQPEPFSSIINYDAVNIANGLVVPIAGVASQSFDLNVSADVGAADLVVDVTGYFTRFPTEQFQGSLKSSVLETDDSTLTDLGSGACTQVNSCTVTAPADGKVVVASWVGVVANHAQGTADKVAFGFETATPVACGWTVDSADTAVMTASAGLGTNTDYDMTLSHGATFPITSGTTQTYYLSIQWLAGANTGDQYENSRMICTFIPN